MAVLLEPTRPIDVDLTRAVVARLVERHDALRLRFGGSGPEITSMVGPPGDIPFGVSDLSGMDRASVSEAIERRATEVQLSFDLERGPLIHVELFDLGTGGQRLLVVFHHFAFDQLSWPPFWEDFEQLYEALGRDRGLRLSPPPSFATWASRLKRRADSDELRSRVATWLGLPWDHIRPMPCDHPDGVNTNASAERVELVLTRARTDAILFGTRGVPHKADLLVGALAEALWGWTGSDTALIDVIGHGRDEALADDMDPISTVGFFISYTPLVLQRPDPGPWSTVPSVREQVRSILRQGMDFDLLRYMTSDASIRSAFQELPKAQVLFNYHGRRDDPIEVPPGQTFRLAPEPIGPTHSPAGLRYYPIAVSSEVDRSRLRFDFVYSTNLHERPTIEALVEAFDRQLSGTFGRA
jgi:non-ribosomal peptide synthase protein (TIGR01720 family)